jgi:6-phosphogluconolactonase
MNRSATQITNPNTGLDQFMKTSRMMFRSVVATFALALVAAGVSGAAPVAHSRSYIAYVGTYTAPQSKSQGIYAFRFDADSGEFTSLGLAAETKNPSFVAASPNHKFLYAVNEVGDYKGKNNGGVSAFAIDGATGKLKFLNEVQSRGAGPCYITTDATGKFVLVANYDGGSVAAFPVNADGSLGEASAFVQHTGHGTDPERQEGPHAHSIVLTPDNKFAIVNDLGLDELLVYKFDATKGTLTPNDPPFAKIGAGSGPRHFALRPDTKFAYALSEIKGTVTVLSFDASTATMHPVQTISTLPKDYKGPIEDAEIAVHPSGKFVYASNRGDGNSIAVYAIDAAKGTLTLVEIAPTQGKTPRSFEIDPTGKFLLAENQESDSIVIFKIDEATGKLTATGKKLDVAAPVDVKFVGVE